MSNRVKKVKHIVINASNIKKIKNDHNKNDNNNQPSNNNPPTNTRLPLTQQQMETSSYRLSLVRNNAINNRFVETEIKESFCTSFFRDNPEMLDTRPPSIKLYEYYEKLGLYIDNNSVQSKATYQKNRKVKINSDDIIKFNNDVKYSHSDNFSLMSCQRYVHTNFTRKEKIQLLSQMIPLELIVHGKDSFELLRAHIMIAYFYNRMRKPHPAIRHLNEAQKIQEKILNISNPRNPSKYSPSSIEKSSRASRKASPSSIRSKRRSIYKHQEYDQQLSVKDDGYHLNEEAEKEIDDEISIEFSNAYLMLAMDDSTSSSAKSKYTKNAIVSLSKFNEESDNTNSESNNDHLKLRKDLAQARLLYVQKKFEESARYYENVLFSITNTSTNENERLNEAVKLDELEETADLKIEAAENIKMIIKGQFNAIKEKEKKIKSCREFEETHYESLIDDIDYALDLYYEARDSYEDAGLDDNVEDCEICIQKLENEKDEVYSILDKEEMQKRYLVDQEEEEGENENGFENESQNKDDQNQLKTKDDQNQIKKESQLKITEKEDKNQHENENFQNSNQLKNKQNKAHLNLNASNDESIKQQKIDHKKGQIAENTVEIHFESSSSFDEKESQSATANFIQKNESKSGNSIEHQENKQKAEFSTPIQDENEYGSDENEDENKNDKKTEKETENLNDKIESTENNSESTQFIKNDDNKSTEKVLENQMMEVANLLVNENKEKLIDSQNSSNKSSENITTNKTVNNDDDDDNSDDL